MQSFQSWDPEGSEGALLLAEIVPQDTIPIEALTLLPSGSTVDLLENLPPKAVQSNYGGVMTLLPDVPVTNTSLYSFSVTRTGWYNIVIPQVRVQGVGTGVGTMYDVNIVLYDGSGSTIAGDNRAIVANANVAFTTRLSCYGYLTKNILYRFELKMSQSSTVLPPADPPILLGGTAIWENVYIFPIISGIDGVGDSPFVVFP
jgi:hypothetical protein